MATGTDTKKEPNLPEDGINLDPDFGQEGLQKRFDRHEELGYIPLEETLPEGKDEFDHPVPAAEPAQAPPWHTPGAVHPDRLKKKDVVGPGDETANPDLEPAGVQKAEVPKGQG